MCLITFLLAIVIAGNSEGMGQLELSLFF